MKTVLIIGASGLLGSRVASEFGSCGYRVYASYHSSPLPSNCSPLPGNLTSYSDVRSFFERKYDIVVNCAGLTNVDVCDSRPEAAWQLNATLPFWLSKLSKYAGAHFIQISTDHFESEISLPRSEFTPVRAINSYGYSKLCGEKFVQHNNPDAVILRTNFFGLTKLRNHSLLDYLKNAIDARKQIIGFEDVIFSPIGVTELAKTIVDISMKKLSGLFHAAGNETLSKYEFALRVAERLGYSSNMIGKGSISDFRFNCQRPNYLVLDSSKLAHVIHRPALTLNMMLEEELTNTL